MYIVKNLKEPLLGRPAVEALAMLQWIEEVGYYTNATQEKNTPKLFWGLGLMKVLYEIRQRGDAQTGSDEKSHNENLDRVLKKIEAAGITLNDKCMFTKSRVKFQGDTVSNKRIDADPAKQRGHSIDEKAAIY
ncbi:hypothetical protein PR048_023520 [Dryococelus australis]|uniref:Uncharacterized protein n=1 Tax=Dryococelus australis TaxID=614101 RepID=A0ABQ9GUE4_9NEOP|nr:hypothetical protein PR048_023520 [Dryococelus australis]